MRITLFLLLFATLSMASCRFFKEKKAEHHQPFNGHSEHKPQHKKGHH